jgi:hypothetical protein
MDNSFFDQLIRSLAEGDDDLTKDLFKDDRPIRIRNKSSEALDRFVQENYEKRTPKALENLFEDKDKLKGIKYEKKVLDGDLGFYLPEERKIVLNSIDTTPISTALHEQLHGTENDDLKGYSKQIKRSDELLSDPKVLSRLKGLDNAEKFFKGHHDKYDLMELGGLKNLTRNKKIMASIPILGALVAGVDTAQAHGVKEGLVDALNPLNDEVIGDQELGDEKPKLFEQSPEMRRQALESLKNRR